MPTDPKHRIYNPNTRTLHEWVPRINSYPVPIPAIDDEPHVCLKVNREWWSFVNGVISILEEREFWAGDDDDTYRANQQILHLLTSDACGDIPKETVREVVRYIYTEHPEIVEEEIDMAIRPTYQKFNGQWYAGFPCGDCGGLEWVALGAGQPIDPVTGAPLAPNGGTGDVGTFPNDGTGVGESAASCYASKAVPYMINRFVQYIEYVTNLQVTAFDILAQQFDEVADLVATLADITESASVVQDIRDLGVAQIETVVRSEGAGESLREAWTFTGPVNRVELLGWVRRGAPGLVNGVALRELMTYWLLNSITPGLNRDLSRFANECETGNDVGVAPLPALIPFSEGGQNYELRRLFSAPRTYDGAGGEQVIAFLGSALTIVGAVYNITPNGNFTGCAAGTDRVWFRDDSQPTVRLFSTGNLNNIGSGGWQASVYADLKEPIEQLLGVTMTNVAQLPGAQETVNSLRTNPECGGPTAELTFENVYIVVEV